MGAARSGGWILGVGIFGEEFEPSRGRWEKKIFWYFTHPAIMAGIGVNWGWAGTWAGN